MSDTTTRHKSLISRLALVTVAMFGFGYLLVPLYDVFCEITGIGGRTGVVSTEEVMTGEIDEQRWVTVEFTSTAAQSMPWQFHALTNKLRVHPGQIAEVKYYAKNVSGRDMVGQAVPSVTPQESARYFNKTECFCFTSQQLAAGEGREMLVRFVVNPRLPKSVNTITLSYAFFDAGQYQPKIKNNDSNVSSNTTAAGKVTG